jgi:hypothetical protein
MAKVSWLQRTGFRILNSLLGEKGEAHLLVGELALLLLDINAKKGSRPIEDRAAPLVATKMGEEGQTAMKKRSTDLGFRNAECGFEIQTLDAGRGHGRIGRLTNVVGAFGVWRGQS